MPAIGISKAVAIPDRPMGPVNQYMVTIVIGFNQIISVFRHLSRVNGSPEVLAYPKRRALLDEQEA